MGPIFNKIEWLVTTITFIPQNKAIPATIVPVESDSCSLSASQLGVTDDYSFPLVAFITPSSTMETSRRVMDLP